MAGATTGIFGSATFNHKRFGIGELVEVHSEDLDSGETTASSLESVIAEVLGLIEAVTVELIGQLIEVTVLEGLGFVESVLSELLSANTEGLGFAEGIQSAFASSTTESLDSTESLGGELRSYSSEDLDSVETLGGELGSAFSDALGFSEGVAGAFVVEFTEDGDFVEGSTGGYESLTSESLEFVELPLGHYSSSHDETLNFSEGITGEFGAEFSDDGTFIEDSTGALELAVAEDIEISDTITDLIILIETVLESLDFVEGLALSTIQVATILESLDFVETLPSSILQRHIRESVWLGLYQETVSSELSDSKEETLLVEESEFHLIFDSVIESISNLETLGSLYIAEIDETVGEEEIIPGEAVWTTASEIVSFTESCLSALHALPVSDSLSITETKHEEIAASNMETVIFTESFGSLFSMGYVENLIFTDNWAVEITFKYAKCKRVQCTLETPKVVNLLCRICVHP